MRRIATASGGPATWGPIGPRSSAPATACPASWASGCARPRSSPRSTSIRRVRPGRPGAGARRDRSVAYDDALRDRIAANIAGHEPAGSSTIDRRRAAVAIVVVDSAAGEDRVDPARPRRRELAWVGAARSGASTGAWSASPAARRSCCAAGRRGSTPTPPVGAARRPARRRRDAGRRGATRAARGARRRPAAPSRCSAMLDDYPTRSGYVMTPVVLWGGGRLDLDPSPARGGRRLPHRPAPPVPARLAALRHHPRERPPGGAGAARATT